MAFLWRFFLYAIVLVVLLGKVKLWCSFRGQEFDIVHKKSKTLMRKMYIDYIKKVFIDMVRFPLDCILLWFDSLYLNIPKTKFFKEKFGRSCKYRKSSYCATSKWYRNAKVIEFICPMLNSDEMSELGHCVCKAKTGETPKYIFRSLTIFVFLTSVVLGSIFFFHSVKQNFNRRSMVFKTQAYKKEKIEKYMEEGKEFIKKNNYKKAMKTFLNVLNLELRNSEAFFYMGYCRDQRGNKKEALKLYLTAINLDKKQKFIKPRLNAAKIYWKKGLYQKSKKYALDAYNMGDRNESIILLASCNISLKNIKEAKRYFSLLKNVQLTNGMALYVKSVLDLIDKRYDVAMDGFKKLLESNLRVEATIKLYEIYSLQKKYTKGNQLLKQMMNETLDSRLKFLFIESLFYLKQVSKAKERCYEFFKTSKDKELYLEKITIMLLSFNQTDIALEMALEGLKTYKKNITLHFVAAEVYLRHKLFAESRKHCLIILSNFSYRKLKNKKLDNSIFVNTRVVLGKVYYYQKNYDQAEMQFHNLIVKMPKYAEAYHWYGNVLAHNKKYEKAINMYNKALELDPKLSIVHFHKAKVYYTQENWNAAILSIKEVLKANPDSVAAMNYLGMIYEKINEYGKAKTIYQKIIKNYTSSAAVASNNLANILEREGKLKEAMKMAILSCNLTKGHPAPLDTLAWLWYKDGQYKRSRDLLARLVKALPNSVIINYHYGVVLSKLKDKKAKDILEKVIFLAPTTIYAKDSRRLLEKLK